MKQTITQREALSPPPPPVDHDNTRSGRPWRPDYRTEGFDCMLVGLCIMVAAGLFALLRWGGV